jgi:hypothetical protein
MPRVCNLRVRQASLGPRSVRNTPLGSEHAPQAQAEPSEMRRQPTRVAYATPASAGTHACTAVCELADMHAADRARTTAM